MTEAAMTPKSITLGLRYTPDELRRYIESKGPGAQGSLELFVAIDDQHEEYHTFTICTDGRLLAGEA